MLPNDDDRDPRDKDGDDDTPETPLDEPAPEPIRDPPAEPGPQAPYVVSVTDESRKGLHADA